MNDLPIINELLLINDLIIVVCMGCRNSSVTYEQYFNINLEINRALDLFMALDNFVAPDFMDRELWYNCER